MENRSPPTWACTREAAATKSPSARTLTCIFGADTGVIDSRLGCWLSNNGLSQGEERDECKGRTHAMEGSSWSFYIHSCWLAPSRPSMMNSLHLHGPLERPRASKLTRPMTRQSVNRRMYSSLSLGELAPLASVSNLAVSSCRQAEPKNAWSKLGKRGKRQMDQWTCPAPTLPVCPREELK